MHRILHFPFPAPTAAPVSYWRGALAVQADKAVTRERTWTPEKVTVWDFFHMCEIG